MSYDEPTWGEVDPAAFERIVVVSPHFDDAAMGAGHLLGSYDATTVITVLAGKPPAYPEVPSDWDALGGFVAGDDVVAVRRTEDVAAMEVLDVGLPVARLRRPPVPRAGRSTYPRAGGPGLGRHHRRIRAPPRSSCPWAWATPTTSWSIDAGLLVRQSQPDLTWFCYEDHGYKHIPGLLAWRVAKLLRARPWATPAIVPHTPDEDRKRRAIWCYTSQIPPLERDHALTARMEGRVPEQFWQLDEPPQGWEMLADLI